MADRDHIIEAEKRCTHCKEVKPLDQFTKSKRDSDGRRAHCSACHSSSAKKWRDKNKQRNYATVRRSQLKRLYGITVEDYDKMFDEQNGVCAICKSAPTTKRLAVDHCHSTGSVRGLLCENCNQAIGKFKDNVSLLQEAIDYLTGGES